MEKLKFCTSCKIIKTWDAFRIRKKSGRPYAYCRECDLPRQRAYSVGYYQKRKRENRIGESRERHLLKRYGLTPQAYENLKLTCENRCLICQNSTKLHVDHNHNTSKVRGLLCGHCNKGIGLFRDNPILLHTAALYLEAHDG